MSDGYRSPGGQSDPGAHLDLVPCLPLVLSAHKQTHMDTVTMASALPLTDTGTDSRLWGSVWEATEIRIIRPTFHPPVLPGFQVHVHVSGLAENNGVFLF